MYVDTNVMAGHTGDANDKGEYGGLVYLPVTAENDFTAQIPSEKVDLIYLCFPIIPPEPWLPKPTSKLGLIMLRPMVRSSFLMRPTKPLLQILKFPTPSMRFRGQRLCDRIPLLL